MKHIAVVEDEALMREELADMLRRADYAVTEITDFSAVTGQLLALAPDLVLLDLNLPEVSGFQICRDIKRRSALPVLVLTSRDQLRDEVHALELGADGVINGKDQNAVQAVLDLTDGFGCDLVIETAGTEFTTRQAIEMVHKGATIVLVGYSKSGEMTLPVSLALDKELTFKTVFRYRHIYPMAIDAVASGKINLKGVVTNIFDFDDIQNAMDKSIADKANIVKAVVKIADETRL